MWSPILIYKQCIGLAIHTFDLYGLVFQGTLPHWSCSLESLPTSITKLCQNGQTLPSIPCAGDHDASSAAEACGEPSYSPVLHTSYTELATCTCSYMHVTKVKVKVNIALFGIVYTECTLGYSRKINKDTPPRKTVNIINLDGFNFLAKISLFPDGLATALNLINS